MKTAVAAVLIFIISGCASIMEDSTSEVYIGAYDDDGDHVKANCTVSNDEGTIRTRSNRHVKLQNDKDDIKVECRGKDGSRGETVTSAASVSGGYWAINFFLIDLCIISCWVDGMSGSWVNMPSRIEVSMDMPDNYVEKPEVKHTETGLLY